MATVKNLEKLIAQLRAHAARLGRKIPEYVTGVTQTYAIYVHENMESNHPVGEAKFLEKPRRENEGVYRQEFRDLIRSGMDVEDAFKKIALHLQRDAQEITPVDTGALRASYFVGPRDDIENLKAEAKARGDAKREATMAKRAAKKLSKEFKEELESG